MGDEYKGFVYKGSWDDKGKWGGYAQYKWDGSSWVETGVNTGSDKPTDGQIVNEHALKKSPKELGLTDYGLESLKKSDFFEADGTTQKDPYAILNLIKQHKPWDSESGITEDQYNKDMLAKIRDMMPKLQAIPEEEKGFAREGFQKDVYGISKDAGKAGAQMQQAYGSGMGSQMRGAFAGMKDVTQQFKQAEEGYAEDLYGLEQKQETEFEGDISTWLSSFKQGGRVPSNRQTFSEVLSGIPDAGGN